MPLILLSRKYSFLSDLIARCGMNKIGVRTNTTSTIQKFVRRKICMAFRDPSIHIGRPSPLPELVFSSTTVPTPCFCIQDESKIWAFDQKYIPIGPILLPHPREFAIMTLYTLSVLGQLNFMLGPKIEACKPPRNDLKSGQRHRHGLSV